MLGVVLVVVVALVLLALKLSITKAPATASGIVERPILSANELEFFHRLTRALPNHHIFPQVAANALLRVDDAVNRKRYHAVRNRFAQKHVDFTVCEKESLRVVALIELDDRTHRAEKDKARDALFGQAGYFTHRFESRRKPSEQEIAALFYSAPEPAIMQDEEKF
jgi:hypothetical protein